jgi:undecaprenyl-diphosphatase
VLAATEQIPLLHAIVLGITQGLSEFLPISSSGHLLLVPWLLGWKELTGEANADFTRTFSVALHIGTLLGAAAYLHRDLARLARGVLQALRERSLASPDARQAGLLMVSAVPAAVVGAAIESSLADQLSHIWLVALMLIVFGVLLGVADRARGSRRADGFTLRDALLMGACQAAALAPGVSRSGSTMIAGRWLGFDRDSTARLSFLMALPVIGGAVLFEGAEVVSQGGLPPGSAPAFFWGVVTSGVTGAIAVWLVLRLVRTRSLAPFVIYRVVVGVAVLALLALR